MSFNRLTHWFNSLVWANNPVGARSPKGSARWVGWVDRTKTRVAAGTTVLVLLAAACWGMVSPTTAPATTESPTQPLPVLLPVDLVSLTTRPPANGFEYALEQSSWGVNDWGTLRALVQCESGFDRLAVGALGEVGALQIHPINDLAHQFSLTTYEGSLAAGAVVYEEQGWGAWSCYGGAR